MDNDEEIINFRGKSRASYYRHKKFIANALTSRVSDCEGNWLLSVSSIYMYLSKFVCLYKH